MRLSGSIILLPLIQDSSSAITINGPQSRPRCITHQVVHPHPPGVGTLGAPLRHGGRYPISGKSSPRSGTHSHNRQACKWSMRWNSNTQVNEGRITLVLLVPLMLRLLLLVRRHHQLQQLQFRGSPTGGTVSPSKSATLTADSNPISVPVVSRGKVRTRRGGLPSHPDALDHHGIEHPRSGISPSGEAIRRSL